jgi:6-phosphogluconolactonase
MMDSTVNYNIKIFKNTDELSEHFAKVLQQEVKLKKGKFSLALSGGSTPRYLYAYLAAHYATGIQWNKINIFWGDERCVPPGDEQSNFRMADESLLSKIVIPEENIFRIKGENNPNEEAERYSKVIKNNLPVENELPVFDMVLLGLGEDGHTASIFPDQMHLLNEEKLCSLAVDSTTGQNRVTLTGKIINNASNIIFIVTGKNKSGVAADIIRDNKAAEKYPAYFIKGNNSLYWYLDTHAAALLQDI